MLRELRSPTDGERRRDAPAMVSISRVSPVDRIDRELIVRVAR